jgi:hypothetical protein
LADEGKMQKQKECNLNSAGCLAMLTLCLLLPAPTNAQRNRSRFCATGIASCFFDEGAAGESANDGYEHVPSMAGPSRVVTLVVRESRRGPFAHHWIELQGSQGPVTIHFGPATVPFIDLGQISVFDSRGGLETIPGFHFLAEHYNYAKAPGSGQVIGGPLQLTVEQSDALIEKERHRKFIGPYIPIFHDCRTFVCAVKASVQGKSTLPCYLLFKGYW